MAVAVVLALAGCAPSPPPAAAPPQPAATPVFASEAEALAAATTAYAAYVRVSDEILQEGGTDPQRIGRFASKAWTKVQVEGFDDIRRKGWRSIGYSKFENVSVQNYDPSAKSGESLVTLYLCVDVTNVNVLDSKGISQVSESRPNRAAFQVSFDLETPTSTSIVVSQEIPWAAGKTC